MMRLFAPFCNAKAIVSHYKEDDKQINYHAILRDDEKMGRE